MRYFTPWFASKNIFEIKHKTFCKTTHDGFTFNPPNAPCIYIMAIFGKAINGAPVSPITTYSINVLYIYIIYTYVHHAHIQYSL